MTFESATVLTPVVFNMSETLSAPFLVYATLNSVLSVTAFLGNALIFNALLKCTTIQPPSKAFFFSLVLSDLFVGLVAQPLFVAYLLAVVRTNRELYSVTRYAYNLTGDLLGAVSLLTMMGISIDRLLALLFRFTYRSTVTVVRAGSVIITFWILSSLLAGFYFWDLPVYVMISFIGLFVCLVITFLAYLNICCRLRRLHGRVQDSGQPRELKRSNIILITLERYKRTVITARYIFGTLLACYFPRLFVLIVWHAMGESAPLLAVYYFTSTLVFTNSSVNPVLYCWRIREVRVLAIRGLSSMWLSVAGRGTIQQRA